LDHASLDPRSFGSNDSKTVPHKPPAEQARAAYIARVVAEAPPMSDAQVDRIALLLRPKAATNAASLISVDQYRHWEMVRHLDSENPGRHGFFTAEDAA
jgi:hypothetical protein